MKTIIKCILAILTVSFMTVACEDMNSIIQDDLDKGETIYPGKAGSVTAVAGIGRVWLYWELSSDSRVTKTVISWTENGETKSTEKAVAAGYGVRTDSIEITGLPEGLYSFSAYTIDKDNHRSISISSDPVNVYGSNYIAALSARGISRTEMLLHGDLRITWQDAPDDLLYTLVTYFNHSVNPNGALTTTDTIRGNAPNTNSVVTTTLAGLMRLKAYSVKSVFQVGLDTASATGSYYPTIAEKEIISAAPNNFTDLTEEGANRVTSLTYPLSLTSTFQDLYYFPNLRTLDLTPGTSTLPTLEYVRHYVGTYNDTTTFRGTVGGGNWLYLASGYMLPADQNIISDLLASGQLTKVRYTPNSYPGLDAILANHLAAHPEFTLELTNTTPLPDDIMIPPNLLLDYRVQNRDRGATVEHSADGSNVPAEIAEKFNGELKNVYKVTVTAKNSTIAFSLPEGVQFGFVPHGHVKMDFFIQTANGDYEWLKVGATQITNYRVLRLNRLTKLEAFPEQSPFDYYQSLWNSPGYGATNLGEEWISFDWNLTPVPQEHIRVLTIQMGADDVIWGVPSTLTYYIANLRFTK